MAAISEPVDPSLGAFKSVVENVVKSICNSKLEQQLQKSCQTAITKSGETYNDVQKIVTDVLKSSSKNLIVDCFVVYQAIEANICSINRVELSIKYNIACYC